MNELTINAILSQLDMDRHLAGFPLEERASPFFRLFLPEVMKRYVADIREPVIPEFPHDKEPKSNRSPKVDFFAIAETEKRAFLIELKTDENSLDTDQADRLANACERGLYALLCDIRAMSQTSDKQNRQKYFHTLNALEELKLIRMPPDLSDIMFAEHSKDVYDRIRKIEIHSEGVELEVVYLVPERSGKLPSNFAQITFHEIADEIKKHGELGKRFARSLICWAEHPAGSVPPWPLGTSCPLCP